MQRVRVASLLLRPELSLVELGEISPEVARVLGEMPCDVIQEAEVSVKYQRYIEKECEVAERMLKFENIALPASFDFFSLDSLSYEAREKLNRYHPTSIGQASRISGVSPADISVLLLNFAK